MRRGFFRHAASYVCFATGDHGISNCFSHLDGIGGARNAGAYVYSIEPHFQGKRCVGCSSSPSIHDERYTVYHLSQDSKSSRVLNAESASHRSGQRNECGGACIYEARGGDNVVTGAGQDCEAWTTAPISGCRVLRSPTTSTLIQSSIPISRANLAVRIASSAV
jgi:hypothetical protein